MKKIVTALACMLLSLTMLAQPANLLALAREELNKRGLEETEVRARLLEEGKLTIGEISERVGYAKQSQFAAAFRKRFGVPLGEQL